MLILLSLILNVLLIGYVILSLSNIKYELKLIKKHLNIPDETDFEKISNEEIENILNKDQ